MVSVSEVTTLLSKTWLGRAKLKTTPTALSIQTNFIPLLLLGIVTLTCTATYMSKPLRCMQQPSGQYDMEVVQDLCMQDGFIAFHKKTQSYGAQWVIKNSLEDHRLFIGYYKYFNILYLAMGFSFIIPGYIWAFMDNGTLASIFLKVSISEVSAGETKKEEDISTTARNILSLGSSGTKLAITYIALLCFNIALVCSWAFLANYMMNGILGQFMVDKLSDANPFTDTSARCPQQIRLFRDHPTSRELQVSLECNVDTFDPFPYRVKCLVPHYGPSGTRVYRDFLCTASHMATHETIFIGLTFVAACSILTNIFSIFTMSLYFLPCCVSGFFSSIVSSPSRRKRMRALRRQIGIGHIFIIFMLESNCNPNKFQNILDRVNELADKSPDLFKTA